MVICLERGADLYMAQLMPLPLIVSCSSKIQIGFTFLVPAHPGSPGQRAVKRVCVCVYSSAADNTADARESVRRVIYTVGFVGWPCGVGSGQVGSSRDLATGRHVV